VAIHEIEPTAVTWPALVASSAGVSLSEREGG